MALDVRYGEIRSEVIAKLETQKGEMENTEHSTWDN